MTDDRMRLAELIQKSGDGDFLRSVAEAVLQMLMEADVEGVIGAGRHERSAERLTWRNGYRDRTLDTRLGSLQLRIPKLRQGSYFPPFLEARKTSEKALVAVIQEAWIAGVSTRTVDDLVRRTRLDLLQPGSHLLDPERVRSPSNRQRTFEHPKPMLERVSGHVLGPDERGALSFHFGRVSTGEARHKRKMALRPVRAVWVLPSP